jgi:transposase-like protein
VILVDAIHVKIRDGQVADRPIHVAQICVVHLLRNVRREAPVISIGGERPPTLGRRSGSVKLRAA